MDRQFISALPLKESELEAPKTLGSVLSRFDKAVRRKAMAQRTIVTTEQIDRTPASSHELDVGLMYADKAYAVLLDVDLLRIVFNTIQARREENSILPLLASVVIKEAIQESTDKKGAFKGAVMKIYSDRKEHQRHQKQSRREQGLPVPANKQKSHPRDPKSKDQFVLL